MNIGTPFSSTSTKVMLLGSGELGKEVIIALQRLDMSDASALRALIDKEKPQFVVPEIEAIATDALALVEKETDITVIPTAKAAQLTMNREGIRRLAAETLELRTSRYAFAESVNQLSMAVDTGIGYPCIVKPVMSSSGKGQSLIEEPEDVQKAWDYAMSGGRVNRGKVIVEEKIEFDYEITLLTVRALDANAKVATYFCDPIGHIQKHGDYVESWQPQPMSETALNNAQHIAALVTEQLGGRGLFGVELFVKGDDVWFSEVSPRPHDTGMVTMASQYQNEFELHARAILGLPVDTRLREPGASAVIYGGFEGSPITYRGVDEALRVPGTEIRLFGKPESFTRRRMGVALARGVDINDSRNRARQAAAFVKPVNQ